MRDGYIILIFSFQCVYETQNENKNKNRNRNKNNYCCTCAHWILGVEVLVVVAVFYKKNNVVFKLEAFLNNKLLGIKLICAHVFLVLFHF